jgi:hypothetical protein
MYVEVKDLVPAIRTALESVSYGARDIQVEARDEVALRAPGGGAGKRGFVLILNLATGEFHRETGDWGGAGLGRRLADYCEDRLTLHDDAVVIVGTLGYPRTWAHIYANRANVGRFLPSGEEEALSDSDQQGLYCFAAIKGGEYRRDEMRRRNVSAETVDSLVERGYLKRNKAGATQITTKGKNARTIQY